MKYCLYALLLLASTRTIYAQDTTTARLLTGPFSGSVTKTSAKIWLAYKGSGGFYITLTDTLNKSNSLPTGSSRIADSKGDTALSLEFKNLEAGHTYYVNITGLRQKLRSADCMFTTISDAPIKDIDFLFGSCAYLSTNIAKVILPGATSRIFKHMSKSHADLMIWLGDNIYYMGKQHSSYARMFDCNLKTRIQYHVLDRFLASMPQYTIWDDHDYGPNDADRTFKLKDTSLIVFRNFWINPYEDTVKETFFTYKYYDAEFFMTDDRWWRDSKGDSTNSFLGPVQMAWLKAKLLESKATFKFICIGSQVLNSGNWGECYAEYPVERNSLLDFIVEHDIKGVMFLTGDTHYGEMSLLNWKGYPFYDFTSSPLTSPMDPRNYSNHNPQRVAGTVLFHKNYGRIKITGPVGDRVCHLSLYNLNGIKKWEIPLKEAELQRKAK
jgi:alkaline phosphatase D